MNKKSGKQPAPQKGGEPAISELFVFRLSHIAFRFSKGIPLLFGLPLSGTIESGNPKLEYE